MSEVGESEMTTGKALWHFGGACIGGITGGAGGMKTGAALGAIVGGPPGALLGSGFGFAVGYLFGLYCGVNSPSSALLGAMGVTSLPVVGDVVGSNGKT